jgi:hypothetical protein
MSDELVNTIKAREYTNLEDGTHLMGVVKLKNVMLGKSDDQYAGFQITFRSVEDPEGFVNRKVSASPGPNGGLFKLLRAMTGGRIKKGTDADGLFQALKSTMGKWYRVTTEQNQSAQGGIFTNMVGEMCMPDANAEAEYGNAVTYFESIDPDKQAAPTAPAVNSIKNKRPSGAAKLNEQLSTDEEPLPF